MSLKYLKVYNIEESEKLNKNYFHNYFKNNTVINYLSVDPAAKNFAIRIEERKVLENSFITLFFRKIDFSFSKKKDIITQLHELLSEIVSKYKILDIILIERQPPFNKNNIEIYAHIKSFFMTRNYYENNKTIIISISPKMKGKVLNFDKKKVKKESCEYAYESFSSNK